MSKVTLINADVLAGLAGLGDESVQMVCTSPPYWGLRDYGTVGQIGLEPTIEEYVARMVEVFREVKRVLRSDGVCFLNLGDTYAASRSYQVVDNKYKDVGNKIGHKVTDGLKQKDLCGVPWRVALALQADGWYLRSDIIWAKPNPMPESCTDRPTKAHEYIFLLTKSAHYFWDQEAVREAAEWARWGKQTCKKEYRGIAPIDMDSLEERRTSGRNLRTVWEIATHPCPLAHFATFPPELVRRCVAAGTSERGCCPKCGAPWVRVVEKVVATSKPCPKEQAAHEARGGSGVHTGTVGKSGSGRIDGYSTTTGWTPTCTCFCFVPGDGAKILSPIPCTVLDPFSGAGTTALVAAKMGRDAIGIELNPEYVEMSRKRIAGEMGMLCEVTCE